MKEAHPPRVQAGQGRLRLRERHRDPLDARRLPHRDLRRLPPVLHGQAEDHGHRGPHREVQDPLRRDARQAEPTPKKAERAARRRAEEGRGARRRTAPRSARSPASRSRRPRPRRPRPPRRRGEARVARASAQPRRRSDERRRLRRRALSALLTAHGAAMDCRRRSAAGSPQTRCVSRVRSSPSWRALAGSARRARAGAVAARR